MLDSDKISRIVVDVVHGDVYLTDEEMAITDSPDFQRLRRVHQTGLLEYIWPSATHTRFEHSIGVLAMAQKMLDALELQSHPGRGKMNSHHTASSGEAIRYHEIHHDLRSKLQRLVRITALVHDLGHGPYSHAFEAFSPQVVSVSRWLDDSRLSSIVDYREDLLRSKNGKVRHEAISCVLFAAICHDIGLNDYVPAVVASILLDVKPSCDVPKELSPWLPFMRDLLSSAPVDADRLDYMARDSRVMNVTYGAVETDRILKSILCVLVEDGGHRHYRLGWRKSGLTAIEQAVKARYQMFTQVYYHKTLRATELMFGAMAESVNHVGAELYDTSSLDAFRETYSVMTDDVFLKVMSGSLPCKNGLPKRARELARQLWLRQNIWKRVYEFNHVENRSLLRRVCLELNEDSSFPGCRFVIDCLPLRATKDLDKGALLLEQSEDRSYSCDPSARLPWMQHSREIALLHEEERSLVRLYVEKDPGVPCDPAALRKHIEKVLREHRDAA